MTFSPARKIPHNHKQQLKLAYQHTSYQILMSGKRISLHIGRNSPRMDRFLNQAGYETYAIISAANPGS
ncbi:MAG: hypothetical protein KGL58_07045, partial [Pseudomonadota bacterium]|nr:hypothetical protein [Pseudomonadota bacterium]